MRAIYKIIFIFLLAVFSIACSDDDNNDGPVDALVLKSSNDTIVLDEDKADEIAVTFSWNKGIDRGPENTIVYIFRLDIYGADFETSTDPIEIPADGERAIVYTNKELNDLLVKKWGYYPGDEVMLQARVVAKVAGPKFIYPEISVVEVDVKSYIIAPKPLYLLGSATQAGLDPSKATKMTEAENGVFYHWRGNLKTGGFKFIMSTNSLLPSLNKGTDDEALVERLSDSDPDNMFTIEREGLYAIALFREESKIIYHYVPYPTLYMIGNATSAEWSIDKALEMQWDPANPNTFTFEGDLKAGELKLPTLRSWDDDTFRPLVADGSINDTRLQVYKGGDDLKWKVNDDEAGKYKITVNTEKMTIKFEKQ
ncbi:SusF/SusE family outer membrane protein [Dysgonomonas sp. ZJ709]|uniref:SusF/SusE family outer membrane protein n=1 Tax=Dysgonomonas sp. ZJ709 TaxID=2709797 RepID=UPI0013EBF167|nr:SusF/SusE family outer membrane protein [Dysgonomonas sp. ZJ709]